MDLPALLPKNLEYVAIAENDRSLYSMLVQSPSEMIRFFVAASDDETWSGSHVSFMKEAIQWMTNQFFQDTLSFQLAKEAAAKIREHHLVLQQMIANNIGIYLKGKSIPIKASSLLWGSSSETLRNMIRQECRDKSCSVLHLDSISSEVFEQIEEFVNTGAASNLWRKSKEEVIEVLIQAVDFGLQELSEVSQDILRRYITKGNVIEMLLQAHREKWDHLLSSCFEYANALDLRVKFEKSEIETFHFQFLEFTRNALEVFEEVRKEITHLICSKELTEHLSFSDVVTRCPKLICLDISGTLNFTDRLLDIPKTLEELDLSRCEWLDQKSLKTLFSIVPNLVSIHLQSNSHLKFSFWGLLKDFKRLEKLDISRCTQVKNEDFKIILQAAKGATHLFLEDCAGLTDSAFFELGKHIPKLTDLDVSRTNITDSGLIDLAIRCKHLIILKASRCPNLTYKGALEAAENAPNLKRFEVVKLKEGDRVRRTLKEIRPYMEVLI